MSKIKSSKKRPGRKPLTRTLHQASGAVQFDLPAAPFTTPRIIDNDQVQTIISNYFGRLIPPNEFLIRTIIADEKYITVSEGWVRNSILTDPVLAPGSYQKDVFDCDDYVQYLKTKMGLYAARCRLSAPLAVGYAFTTAHAFSLCINPDSELFLINTQSDSKALTKDRDTFSEFMSLKPDNTITSIYI